MGEGGTGGRGDDKVEESPCSLSSCLLVSLSSASSSASSIAIFTRPQTRAWSLVSWGGSGGDEVAVGKGVAPHFFGAEPDEVVFDELAQLVEGCVGLGVNVGDVDGTGFCFEEVEDGFVFGAAPYFGKRWAMASLKGTARLTVSGSEMVRMRLSWVSCCRVSGGKLVVDAGIFSNTSRHSFGKSKLVGVTMVRAD